MFAPPVDEILLLYIHVLQHSLKSAVDEFMNILLSFLLYMAPNSLIHFEKCAFKTCFDILLASKGSYTY